MFARSGSPDPRPWAGELTIAWERDPLGSQRGYGKTRQVSENLTGLSLPYTSTMNTSLWPRWAAL